MGRVAPGRIALQKFKTPMASEEAERLVRETSAWLEQLKLGEYRRRQGQARPQRVGVAPGGEARSYGGEGEDKEEVDHFDGDWADEVEEEEADLQAQTEHIMSRLFDE